MSKNPKIVIYGKKSLKNNETLFVNENDFLSPSYNYQNIRESINELKRISKQSIVNKSLLELLTYDEISMWWFFYPRLSQKFLKYIAFIVNFLKFIKEVKPQTVQVTYNFENFSVIKQICNQQNVKLKISNWNYLQYKINNKIRRKLRNYNSKRTINRKIKRRKNFFYQKKDSVPLVNDKIIFTSTPIFRRQIFDVQEGISKKGEYLIDDLVNMFDNKNEIVGIDLFSHVLWDETTLEERLNSEVPWFPVEILFKKLKQNEHKWFLKKYEKLLDSQKFQKLFEFQNIRYWELLIEDFNEMKFDYYLPYWLKLIDSLKEFFSNHRPKCIFLIHETSPLSVAFIAVCKKLGIRTIGIQHGIIYDYHEQYMHDNFATPENPGGFQFPDKMLLFGKYFENVLAKQGYPKERLVTFGNPAFFNLEKIESALENKHLLEKYGIGKNKTIILFTTTKLQEGYEITKKHNYDSRIWNYLLENFGNNDSFFLLLKPHPKEFTTVYDEILKKNKSPLNAKIIQGSLQELIYVSSVIISTYSTTIIDSLCFKKPVINVEFDEIKFPIILGNAVKTTKLDDLKKNILEIINNNTVKNELLQNSSEFIKMLYNIPEENPKKLLQNLVK